MLFTFFKNLGNNFDPTNFNTIRTWPMTVNELNEKYRFPVITQERYPIFDLPDEAYEALSRITQKRIGDRTLTFKDLLANDVFPETWVQWPDQMELLDNAEALRTMNDVTNP